MEYQQYRDVPWYRRSGTNSVFLLVGLFFAPLLWTTCYILLTGDVYYDQVRKDGNLKKWSLANRIVATILVICQLALIIFAVLSALQQQAT